MSASRDIEYIKTLPFWKFIRIPREGERFYTVHHQYKPVVSAQLRLLGARNTKHLVNGKLCSRWYSNDGTMLMWERRATGTLGIDLEAVNEKIQAQRENQRRRSRVR
jgi:hypothetical protein